MAKINSDTIMIVLVLVMLLMIFTWIIYFIIYGIKSIYNKNKNPETKKEKIDIAPSSV